MQKINKDTMYLIRFLEAHYNDVWLFPLLKKMLFNQFNDIKMAAKVTLASALNRHQRRKLCRVKRDDLVIY